MKTFMFVLAFALAHDSYAYYQNDFDIDAFCKKVSQAAGGSYQIEMTCREEEKKARALLLARQIPSQIENYCRMVGKAAGGSYSIMNTCVDQEINAKSKL